MVRAGGQKTVAACFQHDTSRNLNPQLHTHAVVANMVQGEDSKRRTMVDDGLFKGKMAIGAIYRAELAQGLKGLGYGIGEDPYRRAIRDRGGSARGHRCLFHAPRRDRGRDGRTRHGGSRRTIPTSRRGRR